MNGVDDFILRQEEPVKSCLLALKTVILSQDENLSSALKYGMPFFCYKGKMCCYMWLHKKYGQPYIGFVEGKHLDHPDLLLEKRSRMKILLVDPEKDLPLEIIELLIQQMLDLYRSGTVKLNS